MDDESGELMEPMGEVPLVGLGEVRIGAIGVWLTERSWKLIPETRGSIVEGLAKLNWLTCCVCCVRYRDVGLLIQGIEPNGRIHRDGRLRVNDHIVAINGISLIGTDFYRLVHLTAATHTHADICYFCLTVGHRITYKLCLTTWKTLPSSQPLYLSEHISHYLPPRSLRSSNTNLLTRPAGITSNFSSRAFSVSAPSTWNSFVAHIRSIDTLSTFKRHLKFHLFQSAYTV